MYQFARTFSHMSHVTGHPRLDYIQPMASPFFIRSMNMTPQCRSFSTPSSPAEKAPVKSQEQPLLFFAHGGWRVKALPAIGVAQVGGFAFTAPTLFASVEAMNNTEAAYLFTAALSGLSLGCLGLGVLVASRVIQSIQQTSVSPHSISIRTFNPFFNNKYELTRYTSTSSPNKVSDVKIESNQLNIWFKMNGKRFFLECGSADESKNLSELLTKFKE